MTSGYTGKILFVDLTTETIEEGSLSESVCRDFIGGTGLGVRILYEHMKPRVDALGPENMLGFVTGPLTATPTPGSGRITVVCKSPLTGTWAESNAGGSLGPELKAAGYDAIFFSGIAPKPVYLSLSKGKAELKDASHLWGKDTTKTDDILKQELGEPKAKIACIGPAGELCSLISGIVTDKGRIAARSGVGAVMGSKHLKAVAVRGDKKVSVAEPDKLRLVRNDFLKNIKASGFQQGLSSVGTGGGLSFLVSIGESPIRNWHTSGLEAMPTCTNLDGANMDKYKLRDYGCHSCPVRCGAVVEIKEGPFATEGETHRPEYETLAALGSFCLTDNAESVIRANEICNLYGLDTIAAGVAVAFAMECYENGLIGKEETDGIELTWGNAEAMIAVLEKLARREGFGAILADGAEKAAERIGKGSEKYAMHVHGQGLPYHDPRNNPCRGTGYIADADPGRHMETEYTTVLEHGGSLGADPALRTPKLEVYGDFQNKGHMYAVGAEFYQLLSSSGLCALLGIDNVVPVAELIAAVTGWDFRWTEGLEVGRRILTLRQAFNAREGLLPADFKLPRRVMHPASVGAAAGVEIDFDSLKSSYFAAMRWDIESGNPSPQALIDSGLDKLTGDLWE